MIRTSLALAACLVASTLSIAAVAQAGPYKILAQKKVGGEGWYDYVTADSVNRKLYIPRLGETDSHVSVFDLDTLAPVKDFPDPMGRGVAIDQKSGHAFLSSSPVLMWDAKSLQQIKSIPVSGHPDGILDDPDTGHIYILSHVQPNVTVINAKDGTVLGTIDAGGAVEQSVLDGKGHLYISLEDKGSIAVIDTATMKVTGKLGLAGKGDGCAGLGIDPKNNILFAACSEPNVMVILSASNGKILTTLPIGKGADGAVFNPATGEVYTAQGDGTFTVIKETSPTSFAVAQTLTTMPRAKTITLDEKTGHLFTATAEFGPVPAAEPGKHPGRPAMLPGSFRIFEIGK